MHQILGRSHVAPLRCALLLAGCRTQREYSPNGLSIPKSPDYSELPSAHPASRPKFILAYKVFCPDHGRVTGLADETLAEQACDRHNDHYHDGRLRAYVISTVEWVGDRQENRRGSGSEP